MSLETEIDFKELKKQKNIKKKQFKNAIKSRNYDMISECLVWIKKYDELTSANKSDKYNHQLPNEVKEILRLRQEIKQLKDIDLTIYEIFEARICGAIKKQLNQYVEKQFKDIKKQLCLKSQMAVKQQKRTRAAPKKKKLNIT